MESKTKKKGDRTGAVIAAVTSMLVVATAGVWAFSAANADNTVDVDNFCVRSYNVKNDKIMSQRGRCVPVENGSNGGSSVGGNSDAGGNGHAGVEGNGDNNGGTGSEGNSSSGGAGSNGNGNTGSEGGGLPVLVPTPTNLSCMIKADGKGMVRSLKLEWKTRVQPPAEFRIGVVEGRGSAVKEGNVAVEARLIDGTRFSYRAEVPLEALPASITGVKGGSASIGVQGFDEEEKVSSGWAQADLRIAPLGAAAGSSCTPF